MPRLTVSWSNSRRRNAKLPSLNVRKNWSSSQTKTLRFLAKSRINRIRDSTKRCFATKTEEIDSSMSANSPLSIRKRVRRRNSSRFCSSKWRKKKNVRSMRNRIMLSRQQFGRRRRRNLMLLRRKSRIRLSRHTVSFLASSTLRSILIRTKSTSRNSSWVLRKTIWTDS